MHKAVRNDWVGTQKFSETERSEKQGYCFEAVLSFVLGVISIVGIILVGKGGIQGVTGLIFAYIAHSEIKKRNLKGRNFMMAGVVCSVIGLLSNFI